MGREERGRRALGRAVGGARTPWSEATRPAPARTREREWHRVLPSHCLRRRVTSDVRASKDFVPCLGSWKGRLGARTLHNSPWSVPPGQGIRTRVRGRPPRGPCPPARWAGHRARVPFTSPRPGPSCLAPHLRTGLSWRDLLGSCIIKSLLKPQMFSNEFRSQIPGVGWGGGRRWL